MNKENPLLQAWEFPPFDKISVSDYLPAFEQAVVEAKAELDNIASQTASPDFNNTVVAIDRAGERLNQVGNLFFNMLEAESSPQLQDVAEKVVPLIVDYESYFYSHTALFKRIEILYAQKPVLTLTEEEGALLDKIHHAFVCHGARLNAEQKERFKAIQLSLENDSLQFKNNVLAATASFSIYFPPERRSELKGLPDSEMEIAAERAHQKGKENGYLFDLSLPSYTAFMKYVENSELRKQMYMAYNSRALGGDNDNRSLVKNIVNLRLEKARLLGYETYADYVLEQRMLKNTNEVQTFLDKLLNTFKPLAEMEIKEIGADCLPWDWPHLQYLYEVEKLNFNEQELRPYFPLEKAKEAVFMLAERLYDIKFQINKDIPVYHPKVEVYTVKDSNGGELALLYMDFFPRTTKRNGAWMTTFRDSYFDCNGKRKIPLVSLVFNFTPPTSQQPSLLTFREVETLLHEFGHALHSILSMVRFQTISGTSVARDFVELPSQIMENWAKEKEFLKLFACHYQTGEALPDTWIDKIKKTDAFCMGYFCMRQLNFGKLDMAWHSLKQPFEGDVEVFENECTAFTRTLPMVEHTNISTSFTHIFGGGYAAGYYGYKWAELLSCDAFEEFESSGIFSKEVATRFRDEILSKGGSADPMELYIRFKGKEPAPDVLQKRAIPLCLLNRTPYLHQVKYYETDKMTVAHHSNYIRWMEEARVDLLEKIGFSYCRMEELGVVSPVISVNCQYKFPCYFNDTVRIWCKMTRYTGVRFTMAYEMSNLKSGKPIAVGQTEHCFVDTSGRPVMIANAYPDIDRIFQFLLHEKD